MKCFFSTLACLLDKLIWQKLPRFGPFSLTGPPNIHLLTEKVRSRSWTIITPIQSYVAHHCNSDYPFPALKTLYPSFILSSAFHPNSTPLSSVPVLELLTLSLFAPPKFFVPFRQRLNVKCHRAAANAAMVHQFRVVLSRFLNTENHVSRFI